MAVYVVESCWMTCLLLKILLLRKQQVLLRMLLLLLQHLMYKWDEYQDDMDSLMTEQAKQCLIQLLMVQLFWELQLLPL
jgi:hypothetical protein